MQVVLLTGASRGIGHATALALAAGGVKGLALVARSASALGALKIAIEAAYPTTQVLLLVEDLTDPTAPQRVVEATLKHFGRLDGLINNAGTGGKVGLLSEMPDDQLQTMVALNLQAPLLLCKYAVAAMVAQGAGGSIVNINSIAGKTAFPFWAVYCATKAGLHSLTQSLCEEQRTNGIRSIGIYPGACDTAIWDTLDLAADATPERSGFLRPQQVAEAVVYALQQPAGTLVSDITLMPTQPAL
jgi:NADP-dependent 3-hydroxy acid dehydrogenase YdfG